MTEARKMVKYIDWAELVPGCPQGALQILVLPYMKTYLQSEAHDHGQLKKEKHVHIQTKGYSQKWNLDTETILAFALRSTSACPI